jgi:hypothetical protein
MPVVEVVSPISRPHSGPKAPESPGCRSMPGAGDAEPVQRPNPSGGTEPAPTKADALSTVEAHRAEFAHQLRFARRMD